VAGAKPLDGHEAAILNQLCKYRDAQAKKADLPLFKVFSNELLYQISKAKPTSQTDLKTIPHCSEKIIRQHGNSFLKAVAAGLESPPIQRPRNTRPDEEFSKGSICSRIGGRPRRKNYKWNQISCFPETCSKPSLLRIQRICLTWVT
jgi:ribonuclease D